MKPFAAALLCITAAAAQPDSHLGVYLGWVGTHPGNLLGAGAGAAQKAGFHIVRLPLLDESQNCRAPLSEIVQTVRYRAILSNPEFRTIFLTTWGDSNSYNPCQPRDPTTDQHPNKLYLDATYYTPPNRDRMRAEYSDLAYRLAELYRDTGKSFVISNWEGDNELYCDAAGYFLIKPDFRKTCEAHRNTVAVLDAYRQYLTLRHEGIEAGLRRARREKFEDVQVADMIEFSALHLLKSSHQPDMLENVMPFVPTPAFASYSAWESLGPGLRADLQELKSRFHDRLIVGEFGFDRGLVKDAPAQAASTAKTIKEAGIPYAILWQIFDQPPLQGLGDKGLYGIYDEKDRLTPTGIELLRK